MYAAQELAGHPQTFPNISDHLSKKFTGKDKPIVIHQVSEDPDEEPLWNEEVIQQATEHHPMHGAKDIDFPVIDHMGNEVGGTKYHIITTPSTPLYTPDYGHTVGEMIYDTLDKEGALEPLKDWFSEKSGTDAITGEPLIHGKEQSKHNLRSFLVNMLAEHWKDYHALNPRIRPKTFKDYLDRQKRYREVLAHVLGNWGE